MGDDPEPLTLEDLFGERVVGEPVPDPGSALPLEPGTGGTVVPVDGVVGAPETP